MISILKQFKQLKRLELCSQCSHFKDEQPFHKFRDLKPSKDFHGLTHLSFNIYSNDYDNTSKETILTDIDINFPKLKSLSIWCPFTASEWTAQVLTKLSKLENISIAVNNREIIPEIERLLIQNCRKLKSLKLNLINFQD